MELSQLQIDELKSLAGLLIICTYIFTVMLVVKFGTNKLTDKLVDSMSKHGYI